MKFNRAKQQLAAWTALFAILLATLAPTVSHALTPKGSNSLWAEICTVAGAKLVKLSDDVVPQAPVVPGDQGVQHLEHCPFCFTHAATHALLPSASITLPVVTGSYALPLLFLQSPRPLYAWVTAQPRAPPLFS